MMQIFSSSAYGRRRGRITLLLLLSSSERSSDSQIILSLSSFTGHSRLQQAAYTVNRSYYPSNSRIMLPVDQIDAPPSLFGLA